MGRAGITYTQVADAATSLMDSGRTPTVDHVRAALGTGSKSTIAPLLKRWKDQHAETVNALEIGLPATLVRAVQQIHEGMQHEVRQQLEAQQAEHAAQRESAAERYVTLAAVQDALQFAHADQSVLLKQTQASLDALHTAHQAAAIRESALTSENQGLQQRLADRAAQVAGLVHQLEQTRRQFEHYQEASARQRSTERQSSDQQLRERDQALLELHRQLATIKADFAQQAQQLGEFEGNCRHLRTRTGQLEEQAAALQAERAQLAFQYREVSTARAELARRLEACDDQLLQARATAATQHHASAMLQRDLQQAADQIATLERVNHALLGERAQRQSGAALPASAGGPVESPSRDSN